MVAWCENIMPRVFFADRNMGIIEKMENIVNPEVKDDSSMTDSNIDLENLEIEDHPDRFFENMHLKKSIERGIALFNLRPEKVNLLVYPTSMPIIPSSAYLHCLSRYRSHDVDGDEQAQ